MGGAVVVLFLLLVCNLNKIHAVPVTYVVGDENGWSNVVSMETWPEGKTFYAGEILEFKYDYQEADVVVTDEEGFAGCKVTENSTVHDSGDDKIMLPYGQNYFICSYPGPEQCQLGMKMAIFAKSPPPL